MAGPLISILTPCYNAAPWLEAALRSALEQSWTDLEIVVVDDGSTDESFKVARPFQSSRCRILQQARAGASAARNCAFSLAQGEFIQYLDADDLLAPDKLEQQMQVVRQHGKNALTFSSVVHFSASSGREKEVAHEARLTPTGGDPHHFLIDLWSGDEPLNMIQTGQWLTPRSLIAAAGPWNETLTVDDDGEFFTRVILAADSIVAAPLATCRYRKFHDGANLSATGNLDSSMRAAQMKALRLLKSCPTARARRAVQQLLTREIVKAHPEFPKVAESGQEFLRQHGLEFAVSLEGSPWFQRLQPVIGWKATRWLQRQKSLLKQNASRSHFTGS